jgi:hypothetical protein
MELRNPFQAGSISYSPAIKAPLTGIETITKTFLLVTRCKEPCGSNSCNQKSNWQIVRINSESIPDCRPRKLIADRYLCWELKPFVNQKKKSCNFFIINGILRSTDLMMPEYTPETGLNRHVLYKNYYFSGLLDLTLSSTSSTSIHKPKPPLTRRHAQKQTTNTERTKISCRSRRGPRSGGGGN